MTSPQSTFKNSIFFKHAILSVSTFFYILSVILFFTAFGVGINPINALINMNKSPPTAPSEPSEPIYYEPTSPPPTTPHAPISSLKYLGITFGILFWIIGMGAPAIGVLSYMAIWIGLNEKQFTFIRVCGSYTLVFLTLFWTISCGAQVYLQKAAPKNGGTAKALNIMALLMGVFSTVGTVIYLFTSKTLRTTHVPLEEDGLESLVHDKEKIQ